nr:FkbM family methyltransferase [Hydrocoleum sp. CS-953]
MDKENYNFLTIDVQGYELEVLKGSRETLKNIDYILTEVNPDELSENCARVEQLDEFIGRFNFQRVETNWEGETWGDAFYLKR